MSYFGGSGRLAGDPGFFGALKGGLGGFLSGGPLGAVTGAARGFRSTRAAPGVALSIGDRHTAHGHIKDPRTGQRSGHGIIPGLQRAFGFPPPGGGGSGIMVVGPDGQIRRRRRRMNPTNPKALRRAIRRQDAFVKVARGALKNTGFKIVSKSSGKLTEAQWQKRAHHAK